MFLCTDTTERQESLENVHFDFFSCVENCGMSKHLNVEQYMKPKKCDARFRLPDIFLSITTVTLWLLHTWGLLFKGEKDADSVSAYYLIK